MSDLDPSASHALLNPDCQPDRREWLSTNGLGGYASGTVSGANTRCYHGLLVAALEPPTQRTVLLSRVDESVLLDGQRHELSVNFWASGAVSAEGQRYLRRFSASPIPTWQYRTADATLAKQVTAVPGRNAVVIRYRLESGPPIELELKLLANCRDFHSETHGHPDWHFIQEPRPNGIEVRAWAEAPRWSLGWSDNAEYSLAGSWYWGYLYPEEQARGLPAAEDNYCLGSLRCRLEAGQNVELWAGLEPEAPPALDRVVAAIEERSARQLEQSGLPPTLTARTLLRAADQFLDWRQSIGGLTVIAGYHWFSDWGRDTMIALPGLTLTTRRFEAAAGLLRTFARYVDQGLLPNRFPDYAGEQPEYNTVDATLWWFQALAAYQAASGDTGLVEEQYPLLAEVVEWHLRGTRHGIRLDPADGLLLSGEPGVQLTWMDAKVGDWVVTPRHGKPIEIQALWLEALETLASFAEQLGRDGSRYRALADRARGSLRRFWLPERGYLADVIWLDGELDWSLRPNQLLAVGLPHSPFGPEVTASVLAVAERELLTPVGLRTLDRANPAYASTYTGDLRKRDGAYHQGTVWPWLLGPYADALLRLHGPTPTLGARLQRLLAPVLERLELDGCLGSINEIYGAEPPYPAVGCVAQAWSVAEVLRIYALAERLLCSGKAPAS